MIRKLYVLLLLLFIISNVHALGITPGRTNLDFRPGETAKIDFTVVNSEKKEMDDLSDLNL